MFTFIFASEWLKDQFDRVSMNIFSMNNFNKCSDLTHWKVVAKQTWILSPTNYKWVKAW